MKRLLRQWLPDSVINGTRHWRHRATQSRVRRRAVDDRARLVPSFLIIGGMRAGTTSLFQYLCAHRQIATPITKEIHYFDFNWSRPMNWYLAHFPQAAALAPGTISGEASPGYDVHPSAAQRIRQRLPDARVIVLFRNPVARAISHYFHERRIGFESRPIDEALFSKEARTTFNLTLDQEREWYDAMYGGPKRRTQASNLIAQCPMHRAYITQSRYADHLPAWLAEFDRDRILTIRSEDLFQDPGRQLARTLRFLGLEVVRQDNLPAHNTGNYKHVSEEIIARLRDEFAESNQLLYEMLDEDFGWDD